MPFPGSVLNAMNGADQKLLKHALSQLETESLTEQRVQWLETKSWWTPDWEKYQMVIEKFFPGTHLVAMPSKEAWDDLQFSDSLVFPDDKYAVKKMKMGDCHDNSASLAVKVPHYRLYSGY